MVVSHRSRKGALPAGVKATSPSHEPNADVGSVRAKLVRAKPTSPTAALGAARTFLKARRITGPAVTADEQTWWHQVLSAVRGYDALAPDETVRRHIAEKRNFDEITKLIRVMERVRCLDRDQAAVIPARVHPSRVVNLPDRMLDVIDSARRSLQARPERSPIFTPRPVGSGRDVYVLDSAPGRLWIGQSTGAVSPGVDSHWETDANGTFHAVPTKRGFRW